MTKTSKKLASALLIAAGATLSVPSQAAILFSDNFDTDHASSFLNVGSLNNWTISNGTVDYIRSGGFGISCFGGAGGCLDMDGSTGNAGRITSTSTFTLLPGFAYYLGALVSGNQRGGTMDSFDFGIADANTGNPLGWSTPSNIQFGDPFTLLESGFTSGSPLTVRLFFEGIGSDNVGVILDNVVFRDVSTGIPEPASLALLGLGLAGLAATRRRKQ